VLIEAAPHLDLGTGLETLVCSGVAGIGHRCGQ
jgi:hypothetical protein